MKKKHVLEVAKRVDPQAYPLSTEMRGRNFIIKKDIGFLPSLRWEWVNVYSKSFGDVIRSYPQLFGIAERIAGRENLDFRETFYLGGYRFATALNLKLEDSENHLYNALVNIERSSNELNNIYSKNVDKLADILVPHFNPLK